MSITLEDPYSYEWPSRRPRNLDSEFYSRSNWVELDILFGQQPFMNNRLVVDPRELVWNRVPRSIPCVVAEP